MSPWCRAPARRLPQPLPPVAVVQQRLRLRHPEALGGDVEQVELALKVRPLIQQDYAKAFEKVDVIVAPTAPTPAFTPPTSTGSPTLDALEENRRPKASTVCEHCPNSVWFASPAEVKCYCRVMFLVTWSSKEPNQITHCDGEFLGQEQE